MANYYTYGLVPDVDETVYGTSVDYAGLGFPEYADRGLPEEEPVGPSPLSLAEDEPVPANRPLPEEPYYGPSEEYNEPAPMPTRREKTFNLFVEGFTPDAGFATGEGDYDAMQRVMASLSLMDPQALKGISGTSFADPNVAASAQFRADTRAGIGGGGSIYEEGALEAAKASAADPTKGIFSAGFQQLLAEDPEATRAAIEAKSARDLGALAQVEADYAVMKPLSDLLKANRFQEAFALAKETGSLDKLMDTNVLRELRPAFSQQEMRDFFAAVPPEYAGGKYDFKPDVGVLESMDPFGTGNLAEAGYPDPTRAFKRKDDKTVENLVKVAAVAMLAAGLAPIVTGGGAAGGAGASGAGASGAGALSTFSPTAAAGQMTASGLTAGAGAAGSSGALATLQAAGKALLGLPETIGIKIGEAFGANALSSLQAKMIGNAVISGGITGAKGGDLEDILKSAALAAGFTYVSDKAIKTIAEGLQKTGVTEAVKNIPGGDVTAVDPSLAADITSKVSQGLDQFTVTFSPASAAAQMATTAGALGVAQAATPTGEPTREPVSEQKPAPEDQVAAEYTQTYERPLGGFGADLETGAYTGYKLASDEGVGAEPEREVKVTTEADKIAAEDVAAPLSSVVATEAVKPEGAFDAAPTVDGMQEISQVYEPTEISGIYANLPALSQQLVDYKKPLIGDQVTPDQIEEIVVRGTKPAELDIFANVPGLISNADAILSRFPSQVPAEFYTEPEVVVQGTAAPRGDLTVGIPALSSQFEKPLYEKPGLADTPLEEIVVETKRPTQLELITPPFDLAGPESPPDLTKGALEEVVVEGKKPTDTELVAPPFTIPLKTPVEGIKEPEINQPSKLKALLDEYGTLENYLKLLGALGSAFSGTKGATTPTAGTGTGGMGGALPKYTYSRQQLSPDIDYYTYGTRPEAKFFEYGMQLEKPTQPELPPAKPPGDEPVMAEGGLMGYAKGGSKESRYVDGPGSGREDKIPALLSDGEYVIDAETLALLGDGSTKEGARRMDKFRANIRKHKGRALSRGQISPDAKSPDKYMGGGLA